VSKLSPYTKRGVTVQRLTYKICFPDSGTIFRYRTYEKKILAKHKKTVADELETATINRRYTAEQIIYWKNHGLITHDDSLRLGAITAHDKTLEQAINDYVESWDISQQEAKSRQSRLKNIVAIWGGESYLTSLNHQDGIKLRNALLTKGLSKTSVNKHIQEIKRIFDLALANNIVQANAMARVQPAKIALTDKFVPSALNSTEVEKLLIMARINDQKPTRKIQGERIFLGGRLELFLLFYFGCGMRRTEALKMDWNMLDMEKRIINLPGEITKNSKPRTMGIGRRLFQELEKIEDKTGPVLPQYHPDTITAQVRAFFDQCGISIRLHDARHTFSTILQEVGASKEATRDRLGHSDIKMTAHYTHLENQDEFEVLEDDLPFMGKAPKADT